MRYPSTVRISEKHDNTNETIAYDQRVIHTIRILFMIFVLISILVLWKLRAYSRHISQNIFLNLSERQLLMYRLGTGIKSIGALSHESEEDIDWENKDTEPEGKNAGKDAGADR